MWVEPNFSELRLFSSQLSATSLIKLSPFQDLTLLGGSLKTAGGKESPHPQLPLSDFDSVILKLQAFR
jgi:hypothetical protein